MLEISSRPTQSRGIHTKLNIAHRAPEAVDVVVERQRLHHHGRASLAQLLATARALLFARNRKVAATGVVVVAAAAVDSFVVDAAVAAAAIVDRRNLGTRCRLLLLLKALRHLNRFQLPPEFRFLQQPMVLVVGNGARCTTTNSGNGRCKLLLCWQHFRSHVWLRVEQIGRAMWWGGHRAGAVIKSCGWGGRWWQLLLLMLLLLSLLHQHHLVLIVWLVSGKILLLRWLLLARVDDTANKIKVSYHHRCHKNFLTHHNYCHNTHRSRWVLLLLLVPPRDWPG